MAKGCSGGGCSFSGSLLPVSLASIEPDRRTNHLDAVREVLDETTFLIACRLHGRPCQDHPAISEVGQQVSRLPAMDLLDHVVTRGYVKHRQDLHLLLSASQRLIVSKQTSWLNSRGRTNFAGLLLPGLPKRAQVLQRRLCAALIAALLAPEN